MLKKMSLMMVLLTLIFVPVSKAEGTADLFVIHGISGLPSPVDVYVNGSYTFSFDFNESFGPVPLPADDYLLEVKLGDTTVLSAEATLMEGKNYTAVAHFTPADESDGALRKSDDGRGIALSLFENNINDINRYLVRLTVRHTADAPAVDMSLYKGFFGKWFYAKALGLSNDMGPGQFGEIDMYGGFLRAVLFPAGTDQAVFDSGRLYLSRGQSYIVYAIGSIFDGTFTLFLQTIEL